MRTIPFALTLAFLAAQAVAAQNARPDTTADPYRWLEDLDGERAMNWVRTENVRTENILENDPRYRAIHTAALTMAQAKDRIPYVTFIGGALYNFWQDSTHVRGIWRKTSLTSYRSASPTWVTVLDLDALAKREKANWVWHGADCVQPDRVRCLISLSDGGEDAVTVREFDLLTLKFVPNGFTLPKGKQSVAWVTRDTLLVSREWNRGELTASGYPYIVRKVVRGRPLASAAEVYRGDRSDVLVAPVTLSDAGGKRVSLIRRAITIFESEHFLLRPQDLVRLAIPRKASAVEHLDGQVIVSLSEPWATPTRTISSGALASFDAATAMTTPGALAPVPIVEPGPRESVDGAQATAGRLLVGMMRNVTGQIRSYTRGADGTWSFAPFELPENASTSVVTADSRSERAFVSVTGYLLPSSVWLADAGTMALSRVKSLAARFDASRAVVEQLEATAPDGAKVPYFVVRPKSMPMDGSNPTILYAYGGFEVSQTPRYDANVGKLWLERGGVYVVANIRGGGEFGPAWHDAGLQTKRQVVFDDFTAVARDLIARGITSPRKLGIQGGSNGGLLMGVQMTQHPELFGAVDIQVPLLDMLRYEQIAAGASWVAEYGSVSVPDQRAFLSSISPLHNLKAGVAYPTPLIWTTTRDDRVGPQHARKFAAKMSDLGLPYLFYEVIEGGHGSGANIEQRAHTAALEYTYLVRQLMEPPPS